MYTRGISYVVFVLLVSLTLFLSNPSVFATRCQISNVSYGYPHQAVTSQQILITSTVTGSCVSDGEDYYLVRVDLVDIPSSSIVSSNSTPIGYEATNFTVTAENIVTTPANNGTWYVGIHVYVIREGGTAGSYLLDYRTVSNATIQVGPPTAVPEFPSGLVISIITALCSTALIINRDKRLRTTNKS
jgi:hypothetical protein